MTSVGSASPPRTAGRAPATAARRRLRPPRHRGLVRHHGAGRVPGAPGSTPATSTRASTTSTPWSSPSTTGSSASCADGYCERQDGRRDDPRASCGRPSRPHVGFVDDDRRRGRILYVEALGNEALNRRRIETGHSSSASSSASPATATAAAAGRARRRRRRDPRRRLQRAAGRWLDGRLDIPRPARRRRHRAVPRLGRCGHRHRRRRAPPQQGGEPGDAPDPPPDGRVGIPVAPRTYCPADGKQEAGTSANQAAAARARGKTQEPPGTVRWLAPSASRPHEPASQRLDRRADHHLAHGGRGRSRSAARRDGHMACAQVDWPQRLRPGSQPSPR